MEEINLKLHHNLDSLFLYLNNELNFKIYSNLTKIFIHNDFDNKEIQYLISLLDLKRLIATMI
jgi:hypothetical protein